MEMAGLGAVRRQKARLKWKKIQLDAAKKLDGIKEGVQKRIDKANDVDAKYKRNIENIKNDIQTAEQNLNNLPDTKEPIGVAINSDDYSNNKQIVSGLIGIHRAYNILNLILLREKLDGAVNRNKPKLNAVNKCLKNLQHKKQQFDCYLSTKMSKPEVDVKQFVKDQLEEKTDFGFTRVLADYYKQTTVTTELFAKIRANKEIGKVFKKFDDSIPVRNLRRHGLDDAPELQAARLPQDELPIDDQINNARAEFAELPNTQQEVEHTYLTTLEKACLALKVRLLQIKKEISENDNDNNNNNIKIVNGYLSELEDKKSDFYAEVFPDNNPDIDESKLNDDDKINNRDITEENIPIIKGYLNKKGNIFETTDLLTRCYQDLDYCSKSDLKKMAKKDLNITFKDLIDNTPRWKTKLYTVKDAEVDANKKVVSKIVPSNVEAAKDVLVTVQKDSYKIELSVSNSKFTQRDNTGVGSKSNTQTILAGNAQETSLVYGEKSKDYVLTSGLTSGIATAITTKTSFYGVRHAVVNNSVKETITMTDQELGDNFKSLLENKSIKVDGHTQRLINLAAAGTRLWPIDRKHLHDVYSKRKNEYEKAKDLLRTAIDTKIKSLSLSDLGRILNESKKALDLNLTSVSLQSADHKEGVKINEQKRALAMLEGMKESEKKEILLEFNFSIRKTGNDENRPKEFKKLNDPFHRLTLNISVCQFNYGVNANNGAGDAMQSLQNSKSRVKFFNTVETFKTKLKARKTEKGNAINDGNRVEFQENINKKQQKLDVINALQAKIKSMPEVGATAHTNPYQLPVLISVLTHYTSGVPLFNCMSGKDRTGMEDVMVKVFVDNLQTVLSEIETMTDYADKQAALKKAMNYFEELIKMEQNRSKTKEQEAWVNAQQKKNARFLLESGNLQVQEECTTSQGYKMIDKRPGKPLFKNLFYRLFGEKAFKDSLGASKYQGN
jgi:hypothetical protein